MNTEISNQKTFAGLRANGAAFLINLSFFLPGAGLLLTIISLIFEKENSFVRSYSKQTLIMHILILISAPIWAVRFVGQYFFYLLLISAGVFQIVAAVASFMEKEIKIPYIEKIIDLFFID